MRRKKLPYYASCISWPGKVVDLVDLVEESRPIKRETFVRRTEAHDRRQLETALGYDRTGLKIDRDWHVQYRSGRLQGRQCVFVIHSAIEFVFAEAA